MHTEMPLHCNRMRFHYNLNMLCADIASISVLIKESIMKTRGPWAILLAVFCFFGAFSSVQTASAHMDKPDKAEETVIAKLTTEPEHLTAGEPATVQFSLSDAAGKPLQGLTPMHDRYLHVVIVSQDFGVFAHIHPRDFEELTPEVLRGGRFFVRFTFPRAGRYIVGIDFAVTGHPYGRHFIVDVAGSPAMTTPEKDLFREEKVGGLDVGFSTMTAKLKANKETVLSYVFKQNGNPVTDLEPYLGAPMHLAIISSDLKYFLHVHGELPGTSSHSHHEDHMHMHIPSKFGPKIEVPVVFPVKGSYAVFGQVGYEGKVILTRFMVEVQ
jgi:hypothetical protein